MAEGNQLTSLTFKELIHWPTIYSQRPYFASYICGLLNKPSQYNKRNTFIICTWSFYWLSWLSNSHKLVEWGICMCVDISMCLSVWMLTKVAQIITARHRLVTFHTQQTYQWTLTNHKPGRSDLFQWSESPLKVGMIMHCQANWASQSVLGLLVQHGGTDTFMF